MGRRHQRHTPPQQSPPGGVRGWHANGCHPAGGGASWAAAAVLQGSLHGGGGVVDAPWHESPARHRRQLRPVGRQRDRVSGCRLDDEPLRIRHRAARRLGCRRRPGHKGHRRGDGVGGRATGGGDHADARLGGCRSEAGGAVRRSPPPLGCPLQRRPGGLGRAGRCKSLRGDPRRGRSRPQRVGRSDLASALRRNVSLSAGEVFAQGQPVDVCEA